MARPECENCPSRGPIPLSCRRGPAGSIKLLGGDICPAETSVKEIRRGCVNFKETGNKCNADDGWQEKRLAGRTTCMVREPGDLRYCFGYKPR